MPCGVPARQRRDIRGLGRVHQVARREHARRRRLQPRVDRGSAGAGIHGQPGQPGQLVIGDPVAGEDHDLARHEPRRAGADVLHLHSGQPHPAGHPAHRGRRPHRHPPAQRRAEPERGVALLPLMLGDQRDHASAGVRERRRGGERNVLGPDDQGPAGQPLVPQVHPLLQLTGGHHPRGAVAGDQPGRPRPFPAAGGQQHGRRAHGLDPAAAGQRDRARRVQAGYGRVKAGQRRVKAGHRGAQPELGPRSHRGGGQCPRVRRAGHHAVQVAQAEPGVKAMPGHAARLGLPVGHQHGTDAEAPEFDGRGKPGRPGTDHHHGHAGTPAANSRDTAAAQ